jgi:hypothetical protein
VKYFIAVAFVWIGCTLAWILLGSTLVYRSGTMSNAMTTEVDGLWGPPLERAPPRALWFPTYGVGFRADYEFTNDTSEPRTVVVTFPLGGSVGGATLESSRVASSTTSFTTGSPFRARAVKPNRSSSKPSDAEGAFALAAAVALADDDIAEEENAFINQLAEWFGSSVERSRQILDQIEDDADGDEDDAPTNRPPPA